MPNCYLSMILSSEQECSSSLKVLLFQIFIPVWSFSLSFMVFQGFIFAKYDLLGGIFLFVFVTVLLGFSISWKFFKSGNTLNTEYINPIPNPESRISNWSECTDIFSYFRASFPIKSVFRVARFMGQKQLNNDVTIVCSLIFFSQLHQCCIDSHVKMLILKRC